MVSLECITLCFSTFVFIQYFHFDLFFHIDEYGLLKLCIWYRSVTTSFNNIAPSRFVVIGDLGAGVLILNFRRMGYHHSEDRLWSSD